MPSNDNSFDWAAYNKRINEKNSHYDYTYVTGRKYETSYKSYLTDNSKKTIPNVAVSPVTHLIQGFNFIVTLNNFIFGFKDVSGLNISDHVEYFEEGGVNDHQIMVKKPSDETPKLTFSRGLMIRCNPILNMAARAAAARIPDNLARQAALIAANTMDPQASLETGPAVGTIEVYDRGKKLCASYSFLSLGMTEWSVSDLSADDSNILIESITIAHTGLVRVPLGAPNTHLGYIKSGDTDQDYQDYLDAMSLREKAEADKRKALDDARKKALEEQKKALEELKKLKEELEEKKEDAQEELAEQEESSEEEEAAETDEESAEDEEEAEETEDERQAAIDAQKTALDESAAARDEYDKQFEGAEDKRKEALDAQKTALDESAAARDEYDKQFEGAADERQAALDAQKEANEKSAKEREESDKKAKEDAKKAHDAAKEKAEQTEAKKKGGS